MKIKDALSKFYVKLGGSPTDINADDTSGDILEKISDVYTDKEGTHVEVTTTLEEGTKIATIKTNNEDHDIYAPAGGGDVFVVNLTEGGSATEFTADKTPTEIKSAFDSGKVVIAKGTSTNAILTYCFVVTTPISIIQITFVGMKEDILLKWDYKNPSGIYKLTSYGLTPVT